MLIKYTKRFQDYLEKGKEMQGNSPLEKFKVFQKWVVKEMSIRESISYLQNASYCNLGKSEGKMKIGFVVANNVPFGCREATNMEILQIDAYRRANRIYPFPLREVLKLIK